MQKNKKEEIEKKWKKRSQKKVISSIQSNKILKSTYV